MGLGWFIAGAITHKILSKSKHREDIPPLYETNK